MPTQAWVHRARYVGVSGGKPSEVLAGTDGIERALTHARLQLRRLVLPGRERDVGGDGDPGRYPARPRARDRRRRVDVAASLDAPHRRGDRARDGRTLGRRSPRLARRARPPPRRHRGDEGEGGDAPTRRAARRLARRRDHVRLGGDLRGDAVARPARARRDDPERLRLRRRRRARAVAVRPVPAHAHRQLLRAARPAAVPPGALRLGARRRDALPRRLPRGRPGVGGRARASATGSS